MRYQQLLSLVLSRTHQTSSRQELCERHLEKPSSVLAFTIHNDILTLCQILLCIREQA